MKTALRLSVCYWKHTNDLPFLSTTMMKRAATKELSKKTTIIMIDSVEKNLHTESGTEATLGSSHIPLHVLCKAHTVKALDGLNINVLASLESSLKFREALESINPDVKSFLRGEKLVVLCAIKFFDYVLQRENKVKHLSLYQEWRFTKFGYSCTSILDALPNIQMVLAMVTRHFLLMRRNWNVERFKWPCETKLDPKFGAFTALKCSEMSSE